MSKKELLVNSLDQQQKKKAYREVMEACQRTIRDSKGNITVLAGLQIFHKYFDLNKPILDINSIIPEQNDWNPLTISTYFSKYEESKTLVSLGANPNYKLKNDVSLLHIASNQGNLSLCDFYIKKGISIDVQNSLGVTPLMYACEAGHLELVKFLVTNKANYMLKDKQQKTCIDYSKEKNHDNIVKYLNFFYLNQDLAIKDIKKPIVKV